MKKLFSWYKPTQRQRDIIIERSGGRCYYCGDELGEGHETIDHVIPHSVCQDSGYGNMVACCRSCNSAKGRRTLEQFREIMKKKLGVSEYRFNFEKYVPTGEVSVNDYFSKIYDYQ